MNRDKSDTLISCATRVLHYKPVTIAVLYVILGTLWLAGTDLLVEFFFPAHASYATAQFIKGLLYIASTGVIIYWLARHARKSIQADLERKRLELSERVLNAVLASIGEAVLLIDPSGRKIKNCNDAAEHIFGYNKDELLGRNTTILHVDREHFMDFGEQSEEVLEGGEVYRTEYRMKRKDGSTFLTANTVSPAHEDLGWRAGVVSIVRDITDRRQAEQQIQASLHEKEVMLKEIHHRVKNNLSVINSLLSLQSDQVQDTHQVQDKQKALDALDHTRNRIYTMALVHETLYNSEDFVHVNMRQYVENIARALQDSLDRSDVHIRFDFENLFLDVNYAIPCSLILNELATNALSHAFPTGKTGQIGISFTEEAPKRFELTVYDDGVGISEGTSETKGLGFQIVNALLGQINGEKSVDSQAGKGTRIRIIFTGKDPDSGS